MPARICAAPKDVGPHPRYRYEDGQSYEEFSALEKEWEGRLQKWVEKNGSGPLKGKVFSYPRGDGYARYFVFSGRPLVMVHIPTGDAWDIDRVTQKGLDLEFVSQVVNRKSGTKSIFGNE